MSGLLVQKWRSVPNIHSLGDAFLFSNKVQVEVEVEVEVTFGKFNRRWWYCSWLDFGSFRSDRTLSHPRPSLQAPQSHNVERSDAQNGVSFQRKLTNPLDEPS